LCFAKPWIWACCKAIFDDLKSIFDLSLKWCWKTFMRYLNLIQHSFVLCRLKVKMKEALKLLKKLSCLKSLLWKKFVSSRILFFSLGLGPLFIEVYKNSQILFQCHIAWFYWLIFIDDILHLWQDICNISSQVLTFYWPRNIWKLIYFSCYLFQFYFILSTSQWFRNKPCNAVWDLELASKNWVI
jgi:hypothetical protein